MAKPVKLPTTASRYPIVTEPALCLAGIAGRGRMGWEPKSRAGFGSFGTLNIHSLSDGPYVL